MSLQIFYDSDLGHKMAKSVIFFVGGGEENSTFACGSDLGTLKIKPGSTHMFFYPSYIFKILEILGPNCFLVHFLFY